MVPIHASERPKFYYYVTTDGRKATRVLGVLLGSTQGTVHLVSTLSAQAALAEEAGERTLGEGLKRQLLLGLCVRKGCTSQENSLVVIARLRGPVTSTTD